MYKSIIWWNMWCCFNIIKLVFETFVKYNLKKTESYKYGLS